MGRGVLIVMAWTLVAVAAVLVVLGGDRLNHTDDAAAWASGVVVFGACFAVGAAMPRSECLIAPALLATVTAVVDGSYLAWLVFFFALAVFGAATGAGWLVGRFAGRAAAPLAWVAASAAAIGVVPVVAAEISHATAPELPPAAEQQLPLYGVGTTLCQGYPEEQAEQVQQDRALIRELRSRPDHLVTVEYIGGEGETDKVDIRVRELAEEELEYLEKQGPDCHPDIQRELREGLG